MVHFPVIASTISADALGTLVSERYSVGKKCVCQLLRTGINHTYLLTGSSTRYVLRVYSREWRSKVEVQEEIDLLIRLQRDSANISYPIEDKNGEFIQEISAPEGVRFAVLFSFAAGKKVRFMPPAICSAVGSVMATLHKLTERKSAKRTNYDSETLLKQPYQDAKQFFDESLPEMQLLKRQCSRVGPLLENLSLPKGSRGIVHMDIWYDNMNITDQGNITIFDFDFCGNGLLVLDVAYFCKQLFHIEADKSEYESKMSSFLSGYQRVRELSSTEINLIPNAATAVWIFYLGVQSRRFDWSNIFLTENYLRMYVGRMQAWIDYHKTKR